jgi:large subunit ribosomal protein L10
MTALNKKQEIVSEITEDLKKASAIYLLSYQGMTVQKDNLLRQSLNEKGVLYKAVKNTLLKIAFANVGIKGLDSFLNGTSSIMIGTEEDPMAPAKEIVAFHKDHPDFLEVKGINLDGEFIPGSKVEDISKMPGRTELIAKLVTIALGPGAQLTAIIKGAGSTIAGQIKALEEKLEKES